MNEFTMFAYVHHMKYKFNTEDVMPYYDLYPNGKIVIYVKFTYKRSFLGNLCGKLLGVKSSEIKAFKEEDVFFHELPVRKICGQS